MEGSRRENSKSSLPLVGDIIVLLLFHHYYLVRREKRAFGPGPAHVSRTDLTVKLLKQVYSLCSIFTTSWVATTAISTIFEPINPTLSHHPFLDVFVGLLNLPFNDNR